MKKSYILPLLLIFIAQITLAQDYLGIKQSNYSGIQGADLNPAHIADSRFIVDITLGGVSQMAYNNYKTFNASTMPSGWLKSFRDDTLDPWHPSNNNDNFYDDNFSTIGGIQNRSFFSATNIDILNFMFTINDNKIGIGGGMKLRSYTYGRNISTESIRLATNDFDLPSLFREGLEDQNLLISSNNWAEYFVNYAQVVMDNGEHFMKIGGRVKFLQGLGSAYVYTDQLNYELKNKDTALALNGNVQYGYSKGLDELIDKGQDPDQEVSLNDIYQQRSKLGVGFDLGIVYEFRPNWEDYKYEMDGKKNLWRHDKNKYKLKVGFSALDIGGMRYVKSDQTRNFKFNETNFELNTFNDVKDFNSFDSTANANFNDINDEGSYYMNLPTSISLQVDYNIWKDLYVNFTGMWALQLNSDAHHVNAHTIYSLTPRYDYKWAGISIPLSYSNIGGFRAGAGVRLGPFTIGVADFRPLFQTEKVKGVDIYAAVKLPILYGHPNDVDGDKVSDEKDACLTDKGIWAFKGCPDVDKDSIQDSEDACPTTPGLPEFQGCPDSDEDGIKDGNDDCPNYPGPKSNNGCPDKDDDGILDMDDECPNTPGLEVYKGCPDTDEDGIPDKDDLCPKNAGPIANKGCPDTDKDGLFDYLDRCPLEAGPEENRGCPWPDTDGDGILDKDDKCPTIAGPPSNDGCPREDTDGDGVYDKNDECIKTPGPPENNGCPQIEEKDKEILQKAFDNLEFETAKAKIKSRSFESLDDLAELMIRKEEAKLLISGHTDSEGGEQNNLVLSKKRAESVADYLERSGVDESRMIIQYFGEEKPIATNDTEEGRQENRRVEMEILFK